MRNPILEGIIIMEGQHDTKVLQHQDASHVNVMDTKHPGISLSRICRAAFTLLSTDPVSHLQEHPWGRWEKVVGKRREGAHMAMHKAQQTSIGIPGGGCCSRRVIPSCDVSRLHM